MRSKEIGCGGTEAIVLSRIRDDPGPLLSQGGVKPLRAAMNDARLLSSYEQPPSRLIASMSSVQHPGDPQTLNVIHADAVVKHGPCLPCVRQLVIGHGHSIVGPRPTVVGVNGSRQRCCLGWRRCS